MLPSQIPTLENPPVVLRPFELRDTRLVASVADDPLIPLVTTVPPRPDPAAARAYIERQHGRLRSGAGFSFAIADVSKGEAVGQIGLWTADIGSGRTSTGYWVAREFRRRGYARAALDLLTQWAFEHEEVARVQLHVDPSNEASWRLAEACGYEREGLLRSWEQVGAERRDVFVYSVVR